MTQVSAAYHNIIIYYRTLIDCDRYLTNFTINTQCNKMTSVFNQSFFFYVKINDIEDDKCTSIFGEDT